MGQTVGFGSGVVEGGVGSGEGGVGVMHPNMQVLYEGSMLFMKGVFLLYIGPCFDLVVEFRSCVRVEVAVLGCPS